MALPSASAYARSERFTTPKQQTLPKVGPNTYDLPDSITRPLPGFAPFNCSAPRCNERALEKVAALPSSASYYPRLKSNVLGGNSMQYTDPRFRYKSDDGPAPGDYERRTERETAAFRERPLGIGDLFVCKVPYSIGVSPPTIPHRNNCSGYDFGPDGFLKAVEPSWHDLTLGPAFYEPEKSRKTTCERYKGCQWSNRTGRRDTTQIKEGPGPAAYDVGVDKYDPSKCRDEAMRFSKRKYSKVPRYLDSVEINTKRENIPGPGHYSPYEEKKNEKKKKRRKKPAHGFLCSAPRWKYSYNDNPGPGAYKETRGGICPPKPGSMKASGFLVDAPRFSRGQKDIMPGPASYSLPGDMQEAAIRKMGSVYATSSAPFNNSAIRDIDFTPKDARSNPGPGDYNVERQRCFCGLSFYCCCRPSPVFMSKTERSFDLEKSDLVDCATYNIDEPYKKVKDPRSHRHTYETSFDATTQRFGRITDVKNRAADPAFPSAAEYNLADYRPYKSGSVGPWARTKRFEEIENDVPGPGTYTFHPSVDHTCLRGTHNVTLGNPMPSRNIELPRLYYSAIGNKKLRWFARPTQYYRHCPT